MLGCPSWSKGVDLRSTDENRVGSNPTPSTFPFARLAQSVERTALNRVVVGSIPTVGVCLISSNIMRIDTG